MRFFKYTLLAIIASLLVAAPSCLAQTKRALLIGISDYGNAREDAGRWRNIHGANDVKLLRPFFLKQGFKVSTLVDAQATHAAIVKALSRITKDSKRGDLVYIHFSMHGQPVEDLNGDEADGWDEALIPVDAPMRYAKGVYEGGNHLLDDELEKYVRKLRSRLGTSGQLYVVLDACHSGTASRGDEEYVRGTNEAFTRSGKLYTPNRSRETNDYFKVATLAGQSPVTYVEACRSYEQNKEVRDRTTNTWYGSLSYHIAQALKTNKIDHSGKWIEAVRQRMATDRNVRRQHMVIEASK